MTSYSQCGEDAIAWFWLKYKKQGTYIDIGASDPQLYSNSVFFYEQGWNGILVEPITWRANNLLTTRMRDKVLNVAVAADYGKATLAVFRSDMLSTLSAEDEYRRKGELIAGHMEVNTVPLHYLMALQPETDLISVDVEGSELEVLKSGNWDLYHPRIVIVETKKYLEVGRTDKPITEFMESVGYAWLADTGLNTLYCLPEMLK